MWSRSSSCLLIAVLLACECKPLSAEFVNCADCDATFTLTHTDLLCIAKRIDRLLNRPDPVYFDAAACEQPSVTVMSSRGPAIDPPSPSSAPARQMAPPTNQTTIAMLARKAPGTGG